MSQRNTPPLCVHSVLGGLQHQPVLAALLGTTSITGKSWEYSLGPAVTLQEQAQRAELLEWIYQRILPLWHLHHPDLFWLAPIKDSSDVKAMVVRRQFGCDGKVSALGWSKESWFDLLCSGAWEIPWRVGLTAYLRGQRHSAAGKQLHLVWAEQNGEHRRIDLVCTAPESQRCGLATRLMQHVCAEADQNQQLLYLSSSDPVNQRFYERFGFTRVGSVSTEPGVIATVAMARGAAGSADAIIPVGEVLCPADTPVLTIIARCGAVALIAVAFVVSVRKLQSAFSQNADLRYAQEAYKRHMQTSSVQATSLPAYASVGALI